MFWGTIKRTEEIFQMIVFEDVGLKVGNMQILENLNFTVEGGEFICPLGSSGCGKSTILRLIGKLEKSATFDALS